MYYKGVIQRLSLTISSPRNNVVLKFESYHITATGDRKNEYQLFDTLNIIGSNSRPIMKLIYQSDNSHPPAVLPHGQASLHRSPLERSNLTRL